MTKKEQYLAEKSLANRLRNSSQNERRTLYSQIYKEYFDLFPGEMEKAADPAKELSAIKKFLKPDYSFLEIGSGTGEFAAEVGKLVKEVTTLDVAEGTSDSVLVIGDSVTNNKSHITHLTFNGITADLPKNSFDIAYSNQVVEHLHPSDIDAHFTMVRDSLKVGGRYIVITPHRYAGPHDVSRGFARIAEGLHLHEFTYSELLLLAGAHMFRATCYYMRAGISIKVPNWLPIMYERIISVFPFVIRQPLARIKWPQVMVVLEK